MQKRIEPSAIPAKIEEQVLQQLHRPGVRKLDFFLGGRSSRPSFRSQRARNVAPRTSRSDRIWRQKLLDSVDGHLRLGSRKLIAGPDLAPDLEANPGQAQLPGISGRAALAYMLVGQPPEGLNSL